MGYELLTVNYLSIGMLFSVYCLQDKVYTLQYTLGNLIKFSIAYLINTVLWFPILIIAIVYVFFIDKR